jgi:dTDP-4-dehydrorhamnose reductase
MSNLILGNGLLGTEMVKQTGWDCVSILTGFDVCEPLLYNRFMKGYKTVINCVGYTKNHNNRQFNMDINFKSVVSLVDYCNLNNMKLVQVSTDIIYAGSVRNACEDDVPVHAPNWYAYAKLLADGYVQAVCTDHLLIRTAFKPRPFPFPVAYNKMGNFDYVDVITGLIVKLIEKDAKGVYNVGTHAKTMLNHARETVPDIQLDDRAPFVDVSMTLNKMHATLRDWGVE